MTGSLPYIVAFAICTQAITLFDKLQKRNRNNKAKIETHAKESQSPSRLRSKL